MKIIRFAAALLFCAFIDRRSFAQTATPQPDQPTSSLASALKNEDQLISTVHNAARQGEDSTVDSVLAQAPDAILQAPSSVLISRRAAAVCAWLLYDRDTNGSVKLARRVIDALEQMPVESAAMDRFERLYWEAWLRAEILGDKTTALQLIAEAEPLKSGDPRIAWSKKVWGPGS